MKRKIQSENTNQRLNSDLELKHGSGTVKSKSYILSNFNNADLDTIAKTCQSTF